MSYDYPKKYLWDIPRSWNINTPKTTMRSRYPEMPRPGRIDPDAIINSPFGERLVLNMENYILYENEMDPDLLRYYERIGYKKELFEAEQLYTKWSCYTPLGIYKPDNKNKKYPFLFVLHGGTMPIHWEENSGFLPFAAREEMFVVSAQNHNAPNLIRILNIVKSKYPIDESRIYCTGYSQGGIKTNEVTLQHPELFAAAAPCGIHLYANSPEINGSVTDNVRKYDLPFIIIAGQEEVIEIFPTNLDNEAVFEIKNDKNINMAATQDPTLKNVNSALATTAKNKIALLNKRLYSMRIPEIPFEDCTACRDSENEVERKLGFPADRTYIRTELGVRHFTAEFKNDKGDYLLRIMSLEGIPHWPVATMPELVLEFFRKFRRDPITKELIILK